MKEYLSAIMFIVGIFLFALAILVSIALHECGHMWVAQATGMKVRRYFVGFGPTLWSTHHNGIEYGLKAVPAGGFCDIAGMTSIEPLADDEHDRAMYKQKTWKRVAVLAAGPAMNFLIGLVLIYAIALIWGLPDLHPSNAAVVGQTGCVASETIQGKLDSCTGSGPAQRAGIRPGDIIVRVGDHPVSTFDEMATQVRHHRGPTPFVITRGDQQLTMIVDVVPTRRWISHHPGESPTPETVGAIGVSLAQVGPTQYTPITAFPATIQFSGDLTQLLVKSFKTIPGKSGALIHAITNPHEVRDPETPMSVVGASIIGGDSINHGLWVAFWFFLAQLNFVLAILNLLPLLPFDGGHIAIALYEKIRNSIRAVRGLEKANPINYLKLMPLTYVILAVVVGYMLLTVLADFINPVRLF